MNLVPFSSDSESYGVLTSNLAVRAGAGGVSWLRVLWRQGVGARAGAVSWLCHMSRQGSIFVICFKKLLKIRPGGSLLVPVKPGNCTLRPIVCVYIYIPRTISPRLHAFIGSACILPGAVRKLEQRL